MAHLLLLPLVLWVGTLLLLLLRYLLGTSRESEDAVEMGQSHHQRLTASDGPPPLFDILADMFGYRTISWNNQDESNGSQPNEDSLRDLQIQKYFSTQKIVRRCTDYNISSTVKTERVRSKSLDVGKNMTCLKRKYGMRLSLDDSNTNSNLYRYYFDSEMNSTIVGGINFRG